MKSENGGSGGRGWVGKNVILEEAGRLRKGGGERGEF